jgi:hypothetical protein
MIGVESASGYAGINRYLSLDGSEVFARIVPERLEFIRRRLRLSPDLVHIFPE